MILVVATMVSMSIVCGASPDSPDAGEVEPRATGNASEAPAARVTEQTDGGGPGAPPAAPEAPKPKFAGFDFELREGAFWEYRWEVQSSYSAARGSSRDSDSGTFRVTLGPGKEIEGVAAYEVNVTGKHQVDDKDRSFAPRWRYVGAADGKLVVSRDGERLVVLFDAIAGQWPGSGFFTTRMKAETLYEAQNSRITEPMTDWPGVKAGAAVAASHSTNKAQCKSYGAVGTICGNESLAYNERELYRAGIGPVAYSYRFSMSQGSGMSSWSSSATEHLALVASSLRGDVAISGPGPDRPIRVRPTPGPRTVTPRIFRTPAPRPTAVVTPAPSQQVTQEPASGLIAFSSKRDGNQEIYVVNADGTGLTRLTANAVNDYSPAFSPDGTKIAFISHPVNDNDAIKDSEIFVMTTRGANQTNLTNSEFYDTAPAWSPDGSKIAFTSNREAGFNVYVMNGDGSAQKRLTVNDGSENTAPSWAPDGAKIAFISFQGNSDVFLIDPSGSGEKRLTSSGGDDFTPSWSPDGTRIAFTSFRDGNAEIYVINADGSGATRLTNDPEPDWSPSWSPDGAWIAFESGRDGNRDIYVMRADGSEVTRLTNDPAWDTAPSWSPIRP